MGGQITYLNPNNISIISYYDNFRAQTQGDCENMPPALRPAHSECTLREEINSRETFRTTRRAQTETRMGGEAACGSSGRNSENYGEPVWRGPYELCSEILHVIE